ncbi:sortase [Candidatus Shapirobacteria bacterium]|nr:sortase [Candidatus Shapirobacteria bacterium]
MLIDFFRPVPKKRSIKLVGKKGILFNNLNKRRRLVFYVGNSLFVLSLVYLLYLYYPLGMAIFRFETVSTSNQIGVTISPSIDSEYSITIPKLAAYSKIIPNVSPFSFEEYSKVLENDWVAQAKGTYFPGNGEGKSTYLFAHSTRQGLELIRHNSVFYLLGELKNDDVIFVRYLGKVYTYQVYSQKVVSPKEVEYIKYAEPDKELLVLQTCWPLGTDWNRLLVFAKRV